MTTCLVLILHLAFALHGYAASVHAETLADTSVIPLDSQVYAIAGQPLILPALLQVGSVQTSLPHEVNVQYPAANGRQELQAQVLWLWDDPAAARVNYWLGGITPAHLTEDPPADRVFTTPMLYIVFPPGEQPDWLVVAGKRLKITWQKHTGLIWQMDLKSAEPTDPQIMAAVSDVTADPLTYWRAALLADRLRMTQPIPRFQKWDADLAGLITARWRAALDRLASLDIRLAQEVRRRLTLVCHIDGRDVPMWPMDDADLADLQRLLLNEHAQPDDLRLSVESWLDSQPDALFWNLPTGESTSAYAGVVNLSGHPLIVRAEWEGDAWSSAYSATIPADQSELLKIPRPAFLKNDKAALQLTAGSSRINFRINSGPQPCLPPGFISPTFARTLTLSSFRKGRYIVDSPEDATRVMVRKTSQQWELFIECRTPPGESSTADSTPLSPLGADLASLTQDA
ncbi:MAG TPA: hypothetical protein ENJ06_05150, partial [Phycisphaeraceae bacterium]|nr:hypothetical protein [Phycisphaeraceae bacterium]